MWCAVSQIKRLKELRGMLMEADASVAVTVRKLVMVSLMEIFKDITPTYKIRPLTAAEKAVRVSCLSTRFTAPTPRAELTPDWLMRFR